MIEHDCPHCGRFLTLREELRLEEMRCPACNKSFCAPWKSNGVAEQERQHTADIHQTKPTRQGEYSVSVAIWGVFILVTVLLSLPLLCLIWITRWIRTGSCASPRLAQIMRDKHARIGELCTLPSCDDLEITLSI